MEYQFTKEQINEYKDYFLKHGFCVIINILNNERIKSTIDVGIQRNILQRF